MRHPWTTRATNARLNTYPASTTNASTAINGSLLMKYHNGLRRTSPPQPTENFGLFSVVLMVVDMHWPQGQCIDTGTVTASPIRPVCRPANNCNGNPRELLSYIFALERWNKVSIKRPRHGPLGFISTHLPTTSPNGSVVTTSSNGLKSFLEVSPEPGARHKTTRSAADNALFFRLQFEGVPQPPLSISDI